MEVGSRPCQPAIRPSRRSGGKQEFRHFLNIARRSTFENASMVLVFESRGLVAAERKDRLLSRFDTLSRKITAFRNTLE